MGHAIMSIILFNLLGFMALLVYSPFFCRTKTKTK